MSRHSKALLHHSWFSITTTLLHYNYSGDNYCIRAE